MFKQFWEQTNKFYLINSTLLGLIIAGIMAMFFVQFKVEAANDEIGRIDEQIALYKDELQLLEIEWVYLTRPERIRTLSAQYLKNNGYALARQIKSDKEFTNYHLANYRKSQEELAQVSF